tara:strand:+ start:1 stop:1629 length:1629 start_codon:yes stop_codon:yes gene_type:complete
MTFKFFLLFIFLVSFNVSATETRPNVIIFLVDDLGWADISLRGAPFQTPNIDSIFEEGMTLNRFYTTPICSPTRAALMTGRDPLKLGVAYSVIMPWMNNGIHTDEHFMPESFKLNGYETSMIGKWHLGHSQENFHPNQRGFDHFYGHLHTEVGYFPPFSNQGGIDFQKNGVTINDDGYETFLLAKEASQWIKSRDTQKPFFMYVPFLAPHTPLEAPDNLVKKYKDLEDTRKPTRSMAADRTRDLQSTIAPSARPLYAAVVDALDQAIGQILLTIEEEGIEEDTIILFSSDNGGATYGGGGADNFPLRGGKGDTFEGSIRVVAAMKWKGTIDANSSLDQIMTVMDIFPTLSSATGIQMKNTKIIDGRDMWPAIIDDQSIPLMNEIYFVSEIPNYGQFHTTVFNEQWKLVQSISSTLLEIKVENKLFDIANDPFEYIDLANTNPDVVKEMAEKIRRWRALHPIAGTRTLLVPPPGWRAPKDWSTYTIAKDELQNDVSLGFGVHAHQILDFYLKDHGRIVYDCEPGDWEKGNCMRPEKSHSHEHQ